MDYVIDYIQFLGMHLNKGLPWKVHIDSLCATMHPVILHYTAFPNVVAPNCNEMVVLALCGPTPVALTGSDCGVVVRALKVFTIQKIAVNIISVKARRVV